VPLVCPSMYRQCTSNDSKSYGPLSIFFSFWKLDGVNVKLGSKDKEVSRSYLVAVVLEIAVQCNRAVLYS
jgi:hypothetical protein